MPLYAQIQRSQLQDGASYEGEWPKGEGVLYSQEDGLIIGTFEKGKPHGKCICYKPNGDVYWGDFKKGRATGHAYLFNESGNVIAGGFKNGRFHGIDTTYKVDGSLYIAKYRNGKHKERIYKDKIVPDEINDKKPSYPRIDFRHRQEEFLKELEVAWQNYYIGIKLPTSFIHPKFQGGNVDDFTLWVNSHVEYPSSENLRGLSRTVLVEFTVLEDGSVTDVHAVFGSNTILNAAAEKAVSSSPKWEPAEHKGEKVSARMTIPVVFNME